MSPERHKEHLGLVDVQRQRVELSCTCGAFDRMPAYVVPLFLNAQESLPCALDHSAVGRAMRRATSANARVWRSVWQPAEAVT